MKIHRRHLIFVLAAAFAANAGCGGSSTFGDAFQNHARFFNASTNATAISLVASANGDNADVGTQAGGGVSGYVQIPVTNVGGVINTTSFTAKNGANTVASLANAQVLSTDQVTVAYVIPPGGQQQVPQPVLKMYAENQNPQSAGNLSINLINLRASSGGAIDMYFLGPQASPVNQGPMFQNVNLYGATTSSVLTTVPAGSRLAVTAAGSKTILAEMACPTRSFSVSGNITLFYVDSTQGNTPLKLVDDTRS